MVPGFTPQLERVGVHALLGDEGPDPGDPHQHPIGRELTQRPVRGHARDREGAGQLVLRGHARPSGQCPAGDLLENEVLHLQIAGGGGLE